MKLSKMGEAWELDTRLDSVKEWISILDAEGTEVRLVHDAVTCDEIIAWDDKDGKTLLAAVKAYFVALKIDIERDLQVLGVEIDEPAEVQADAEG